MERAELSIPALIQGCCQNERSSQRELYALLNGYAYRICYRYTAKTEEIEELVNESFLKLFKNIARFDKGRQPDILLSLKGWFKKIIVNTCIDHYRKRQQEGHWQELSEDSLKLQDHSVTGIDSLSYKEIIEAIRQLSPAYRTVFNLYVIEGLSHEEIAQQLKISTGTSKSNLSKARENLKKIILKKNSV